ncbi:MAG: shikimate dehydrogenase [Nitrospiraceae bacterium]|nr:shikimate dehydrogenase [Nitrospiraceae bacterium]
MRISAKTKVIALFGYPVEHSLSPSMHNTAFKHLKLDFCYVCFSVKPDELKNAAKAIKALSLTGVNVTVPHKEKIMPFLDEIDAEAAFIGAVNTVVNENGKLKGYNTDGRGFMKSVSKAGITVKNKRVLVIGAGGASRAVCYYLGQKALKLIIFDVNNKKSNNLANDLKEISPNIHSIKEITNLEDIDLIINATPLGLKNSDPMPLDIKLIKRNHIVCDLIYKKTKFLASASKKGCKTMSGLGMLLWQGVFAFELWTGKKPPVDLMKKAIL